MYMFNNIILYRFDQYMILGTSTCKPTHVCKYANKLVKQKNADEGKWGNVKQLGKEGSIFLPQK